MTNERIIANARNVYLNDPAFRDEAPKLRVPDSCYLPYRQFEGGEGCPGDDGLSDEELSGPCPWADLLE